jgi:protein subunit release factor B
MIPAPQEVWLQITAGHGPVECAWGVIQVLERLRAEAAESGLEVKVIELEPGQSLVRPIQF